MALMVPPNIPADAPPSEKTVFNNLKRSLRARDWTVFHSVKVLNRKNPSRPREIDFAILIPERLAVICLEVKGGSYVIRNGQWYRPYEDTPEASPLEQSRTAMFALKDQFADSHFRGESLLSLGYAVAFTDGSLPSGVALPDPAALIIERTHSRSGDRLAEMLLEYAVTLPTRYVNRRLREQLAFQLAQRDLNDLKSALELPNMTITTSRETIFRDDLDSLRPQLLELTEQQIGSLDMADLNDRCLIDGAAGTGKTVLAMELARRRCEAGERVALLCGNPILSRRFDRWVHTLPGDGGGVVEAGTPATLPLRAFRGAYALIESHRRRLDASPGLEDSLKPSYAYSDAQWELFIGATIEDVPSGGIFDYLIVDEAQNLCEEPFLKLMDALLKGGLASGRWAMFGDFAYQNIVSPRLDRDGRDTLRESGVFWANVRLTVNCRNTHEIAAATAMFVDIESPTMSGVHGPLVEVEYFKSSEERDILLDRLISGLKDNRFFPRQIILLSGGDDDFGGAGSYAGWGLLNIREPEAEPSLEDREDVLAVSGDSSSRLRFSDVFDFQGLESDIVILVLPATERQVFVGSGITLPDFERLRRILYTGMSRARAMLVIVAHESYQEHLNMNPRFEPTYLERLEAV